jgi:hypothetical protein
MPSHGFIADADLDAVVASVVAAAKQSGLAMTVEVGQPSDGVELRLRDATRTHVHAVAQGLGAWNAMVRFAHCEIEAGSGGKQLSAFMIVVTDGELEERDLSEDAAALLRQWTGGGVVHEEDVVAQGLAASLLQRDPDAFRPAKMMRFKPRR